MCIQIPWGTKGRNDNNEFIFCLNEKQERTFLFEFVGTGSHFNVRCSVFLLLNYKVNHPHRREQAIPLPLAFAMPVFFFCTSMDLLGFQEKQLPMGSCQIYKSRTFETSNRHRFKKNREVLKYSKGFLPSPSPPNNKQITTKQRAKTTKKRIQFFIAPGKSSYTLHIPWFRRS